ncbi:MAG TPA: NAD-dependent epimerase/dehydratase family protein [Polyangiales bacterium]|nr:NAD-dependent epimerase/dehydratase family protein [Polyangiales bacterium]
MKVIITGSSGLIGSEAVLRFAEQGHVVYGIDNNLRRHFFGPDGDTTRVLEMLRERAPRFVHCPLDIREREEMARIVREVKPDAIIHCAAQPSHDLAARMPFEDFDTNAVGTLNLLEATRRGAPEAVFVFMSTNKVYGDAPNRINLVEHDKRWDFADPAYERGIAETFSIDQSLHSLFGASKVAADVVCQEYGRYFGLRTGIFRGGCLTGVNHAAAELHGYLAYLFKAASDGREYTIFGYKGKQVRDQIHSADVVQAFELFIANPRPGEVYNLGGGKANSVSILESIDRIEQLLGKRLAYRYSETNRIGDHICYYSDLSKLQAHYPSFRITRSIDDIFEDFARATSRVAEVA